MWKACVSNAIVALRVAIRRRFRSLPAWRGGWHAITRAIVPLLGDDMQPTTVAWLENKNSIRWQIYDPSTLCVCVFAGQALLKITNLIPLFVAAASLSTSPSSPVHVSHRRVTTVVFTSFDMHMPQSLHPRRASQPPAESSTCKLTDKPAAWPNIGRNVECGEQWRIQWMEMWMIAIFYKNIIEKLREACLLRKLNQIRKSMQFSMFTRCLNNLVILKFKISLNTTQFSRINFSYYNSHVVVVFTYWVHKNPKFLTVTVRKCL